MLSHARKVFLSHKTIFVVAALFCVGILVYANSFGNGMFWDDNDWLVNNAYVHNFQIGKFFSENLIAGSGLQSNYWRPLLLITHAIEWKAWGTWTPGYHVVNALIHIGNALLIFFLFSKLFKKWGIAFFSSLLFVIHPLQTEAITYVAGRGDPLSLFLSLAGMLFYLSYIQDKNENKKAFYYGMVVLFFVLALLSKERAVIFPAFLILIELWVLIKAKSAITKEWIKNTCLAIFPFFLIAGIFLLLRGTILNFGNTFNIYGAETYYTTHISARIFTFFHTIPSYLSLVFAPLTLYMERSENVKVISSLLNTQTLLGILMSLVAFGYSIFRFMKKPEYLFAFLFFAIGIFPASGIFVPVAGLMQEHYMYVPILGIALFIGTAIVEIYEKKNIPQWSKIVLGAIIVLWVTLLGVRTIMRNAEWHDAVTFYEQTLRHAPTSLRVWNNLGMAYADENSPQKALDAYEHAITLNSQNPIPYYNSGNAYEAMGNTEKAKEYWKQALSLNPNFLPARIRLGKYESL